MTISRRGAAFCAGAVLMRVDVFSNLWYEIAATILFLICVYLAWGPDSFPTEINHETTSKD
jgi:hypothetical protein